MAKAPKRTVPALRVEQWLASWDKVKFDPKKHRAKPESVPICFLETGIT
jgi:hypothetical protein